MTVSRHAHSGTATAGWSVPWLLAALLVLAVLWSLTVGNYPITLGDQWRCITGSADGADHAVAARMHRVDVVLRDIRLPRLTAAVLIGAALSTSGAAYQAMFVNPLVSPALLGVLAGAGFGAACGMLVGASWLAVQACAFAGGLLAVGLALFLAAICRGDRQLVLILSGVISTALFTALLSAAKYVADPKDQLPAITYWLMGGLSRADGPTMVRAAPVFLAGMAGLFACSRQLDLLSLGDEEAQGLGVSVGPIRLVLIGLTTVLCAATVSIAGLIGWVGLIIPHAGRMLVGPDNHRLLPTVGLLGGLFLLLVDDLARLSFSVEIPLGILTALIGIPFFPLVLRHARRAWS